MNLGEKIKHHRKLKGLTQEELAESSSVTLRTIQRIKNNESQPRGKTLILICEALNIDIEELLKQQLEANYPTNSVEKSSTFNYKLASKGKRLIASIMDSIILTIVFFIPFLMFTRMSFTMYLDFFSNPIGWLVSSIFSLIIGAILYPYLIGNIGHSIFNLKVISSETGEDFNKASQGAFREFLKSVLCMFIIPSIWILWDDKNQNLYDKFTKTYVVEKN